MSEKPQFTFSLAHWEDDEYVIVAPGVGIIGQTLPRQEAQKICEWLNTTPLCAFPLLVEALEDIKENYLYEGEKGVKCRLCDLYQCNGWRHTEECSMNKLNTALAAARGEESAHDPA